jgi:hypothetical protein
MAVAINNMEHIKYGPTLTKRWQDLLNESQYDSRPMDTNTKFVTAFLLENMNQLNEAGQAADVTGLQHIFMGLVRRAYPNLITNELVGVQPLKAPGGIVFYLKTFLTTANKSYLSSSGKTSEIGVWDDVNGGYKYDQSYSSPYASAALTFAASGVNLLLMSSTAGAQCSVTTSNVIVLTVLGANGTEIGGIKLSSNGSTYSKVANTNWGTVTYANTNIQIACPAGVLTPTGYIAVDGTAASVTRVIAYYPCSSPYYNGEGDGSYGNGYSGIWPIPQVEFRFESQPIGVVSRKLKTAWSIEMEQDLKAYHNEDAQELLVAQISMQMMLDIDREVIGKLRSSASFFYNYDFTNPGGPGTLTGSGLHLRDYNEGIAMAVNYASNVIYQRSMRGVANWGVTNPVLASRLDALNIFRSSGDSNERTMGLESVGTLGRKLKIFTDPIYPANEVLLGYKGPTPSDTGFVYAPYVPLQATATLLDPSDMTSKKALICRYGTLLVDRGQYFYGRVVVNNLPEVSNMNIINITSGLPATSGAVQPQGGLISTALNGYSPNALQ